MATVSAVAQAQGTVSVDGDIKNGVVTHGASYMARSGLGQGAAPMDRQSLAVMVGALDMASGLSLPTSGLFITQTAPGHRYLIETNSAYIDTQRFIGSSYFLDRMGFSDMTVRLLGDAFFETRLVRDSIMSLGHRRFLSADIDSDEAQMTMLYDNAVAAAESLGLEIGQALTPDQVAALDNDMLWLVKTTVQGETVLAPTLYLSSATRATLRDQRMNGSVLAGQNIMGETGVYNGGVMHAVGDMIFNATGIQNSGQFMAGNALTMNAQGTVHHSGMLQAMTLQGTMGSLDSRGDIHATSIDVDVHGDILHSGDMQADQSLALRSGGAVTHSGTMAAMETTIDATNDIRNTGRLSGKDALTLTSTDGAVVNDVTVTTHRLDGDVTDEVANVGVMATNGTLRMTAGGDVVNHATLDVQGDAMIAADGDIKLTASALTQSVIDDGYSIDRTHHQGSSTTIGGHLTASSGQDILVQGSALSVGGDADMDAGGDVTIESVATVRADQSLKGRSSHQWVDHDGASVAVGGDLNASGDDISIDGSEVSVKHHGRLDARGNISIASVQNAESLNRSFSRVSQSGSQLSAGESLTLTSGKDIEIEASEVSSEDRLDITAGGGFEGFVGQ